jgi:purine-nucleoside phosphorylase
VRVSAGSSWTIDTPYRETRKEVQMYREEGVLTVEMEASALFSVARASGVEAAVLFTVSDSLGGLDGCRDSPKPVRTFSRS